MYKHQLINIVYTNILVLIIYGVEEAT